ncbi:MAG: phage tail sheath subtilisin-like domain-containing protein, partial [Methylophagaceae bacterium]
MRVSSVNNPTLNYVGNDGITVGSNGVTSFSGSLPIAQSGSFQGAAGNLYNGIVPNNHFVSISNTNTQGLTAANYTDAISILENKDEYVFNIISAPGLIYDFGNHKVQLDSIISLAETRGDAIAVVDIEQYGATVSNVTAAASTVNSSYTATYWPWLQTQSATGKNEWIPASTVIPGVYAFTDGAAAPWFAPAGLTRGGIPNVIQAERKLTRAQRDTLYNSNVNP